MEDSGGYAIGTVVICCTVAFQYLHLSTCVLTMGKGFNNYMCKKFFHPGSIDNLKRVWMAQQKTDAEKKKQEELKAQYDKEQELYNNKALLVKGENKEKLSLNFMYEPPAGMKKEREREDGEPEFKFEWQRKYNGPRESYLSKDDDTIRDQPFGIQVRNVRCIKCKKWGHINTDKECELYTAPWELTNPTTSTDPLELMRGMRDNGLALKAGVVEGTEQIPVHQLVASDDGASEEETEEMKFIKSLSQKDKLKLLKKLSKLQKKKKKKQKKKSKSKRDLSDSDSSSSSEDDGKRDKHGQKRKHSSQYSEHELGHKRAGERRRHSSTDDERHHKQRKRDSESRKGRDKERNHDGVYVKEEDQKESRKQRDRSPHHARSKRRHEGEDERKRGHRRSDSYSRSPDSKRASHKQRDRDESRNKAKMTSDDERHFRKIKKEADDHSSQQGRHSERGKKSEKRRHISGHGRSPEYDRRDSKR